jgi:hypothetical protein
MKTNKTIPVICFIIGGVTAYYAMPKRVETKTVTVEVQNKKSEQDTVIVEKTNKDGTKTKTTTIKTKTETQNKKDNQKESNTVTSKPEYHISLMGGVDINNLSNPFIIGVHAQKQFIGPFSLGIFGFTNKTAGVSVGIQF